MSRAHHRVVAPRVGSTPAALDRHETEILRTVPVTELSDLVGPLYTMDPAIRPLGNPIRVVGAAVTVRAPHGDNWAVYGGLSRAGAGHVLVVDWCGYHRGSGAGAVALTEPARRGLAGVVIDGGWRDLPEIDRLGVGVYGRSRCTESPSKQQRGEINVPASCGHVVVSPGDVVVADPGGVVVVPRTDLAAVVAALDTEDRAATDPAKVARIEESYWNEEGK